MEILFGHLAIIAKIIAWSFNLSDLLKLAKYLLEYQAYGFPHWFLFLTQQTAFSSMFAKSKAAR